MSLLVNLFYVIQLYPRENALKNTLLVLVMLCLALIGLSRLMSPNLFSITFRDFWSLKFYSDSFSGSDNLSPAAHVLLSLNLFVSANICLIAGLQGTLPLEQLISKSFFMVASFFLIQQIGFRIVSFVLTETTMKRNLLVITQQTWNFLGFVLLLLATLILLNEKHVESFKPLIYIALFLLSFTRIMKGLVYARSNNYHWFYIILYLCSLEILPLVIIGRYFQELF